MKIGVNIRELLEFFDANELARPHASAIKNLIGEELAFAVLAQYFEKKGRAEKLPLRCTTGGRPGYWLDGWLRVSPGRGPATYYQVEVKSWSFHGIGSQSRRLRIDCTPDDLQQHKQLVWASYWDDGRNLFTEDKLNKVLLKMDTPPGPRVRPLLCLWEAVHPCGKPDEFFSVPVGEYRPTKNGVELPRGGFKEVHVFSVSSYLRNQLAGGKDVLCLELPAIGARLGWLDKLLVRQAGALV